MCIIRQIVPNSLGIICIAEAKMLLDLYIDAKCETSSTIRVLSMSFVQTMSGFKESYLG